MSWLMSVRSTHLAIVRFLHLEHLLFIAGCGGMQLPHRLDVTCPASLSIFVAASLFSVIKVSQLLSLSSIYLLVPSTLNIKCLIEDYLIYSLCYKKIACREKSVSIKIL